MAERNAWQPRMLALDIDGTLLKWIDGEGATHEKVERRVYDAVHRAMDAGAHIVLASGRSAHGMTGIADLLDLSGQDGERLWVVASNGSVIFRYDVGGEVEVVHEETFDAAPVVQKILDRIPEALVAVEERGVGYRLNCPFPEGELTGEMIVTDVAELVADPVSRVIIRDPNSSADEFVQVAEELGLHGTSYVVGWTAWMDLAPKGVSKASGLEHVAQQLRIEAADVLAIGDGRNDLEMFEWAGLSVAMGQAIDQVREAADAVTDSVYEDGAAVEIERWFG